MVSCSKRIEGLRKGLERFFDKKFTDKGFDINPSLDEGGYNMAYQDTEYTMDFDYSKGKLSFKFLAKLSKSDDGLSERIEANRMSNRELNKTEYLAQQEINTNSQSITLTCRLKKVPKGEEKVNSFCECHLWPYIIQGIMMAIIGHEKSN